MLPDNLIYETPARYDFWLKALLAGIVILEVGMGFWLLWEDPAASGVFFAVGVVLIVLFYSIMPRRYQVRSDRLVIVLGGPFNLQIPYSTIREARRASGASALGYLGLRLATSTGYVVQIMRSRGINMVISPENGDIFLEQLDLARGQSPLQ